MYTVFDSYVNYLSLVQLVTGRNSSSDKNFEAAIVTDRKRVDSIIYLNSSISKVLKISINTNESIRAALNDFKTIYDFDYYLDVLKLFKQEGGTPSVNEELWIKHVSELFQFYFETKVFIKQT